jgi:hypothetical protein
MTALPDLNPIFVHASPRSGSTYFFNVLRRNDSLVCFNEAIIDVFSDFGKRDIARYKAAQKWNVNHHFLDRDDFDEFVGAWDEVMHLYPKFPSFQDYLPPDGILPSALRDYLAGLMKYARSRAKRPALCEIHSRGRAGALRGVFGGFHIAQYRDPLSQFGSFVRPVIEGGEWGFLTFPLMEMGISGGHPLYRLVPEAWRVPVLPWPAADRAERWSSAVQYMAMAGSPDQASIERLLRWHLLAWTLSNLAAVGYSDFVLDIDRLHDEAAYRHKVTSVLASECGVTADFGDLAKFSRYHEFEGLDVAAVCDQVTAALKGAQQRGELESALQSLGTHAPVNSAAATLELLLAKIQASLASMKASTDRRRIGVREWQAVVEKHRMPWFNPSVRNVAQRVYPLAAPIARAARRMRAWC